MNAPSFYQLHTLYTQVFAACAIYWCKGLLQLVLPPASTAQLNTGAAQSRTQHWKIPGAP